MICRFRVFQRISIIFSLVFVVSSISFSQDKTSLWKVTAEGSERIIYVGGSIHILAEEDHPLPDAFEKAYRDSDELVLEIATSKEPGSDTLALQKGMYGNKGKISDDLSPEMYGKLVKYLKDVGLPATAMDGFRPWMASMTISITEIMKLGGRPDLGVDTFFESKAIEDKKIISSLETTDFQIGLFTNLSKEDQEKMLLSTLKEVENIENDFPKMVKAWREGDDSMVEEIINESMVGSPNFREELLDKRNVNWAKKINDFMKGDRDKMVIVGAAHLVGEKGLVTLLREKGLKVERWNSQKNKSPQKEGEKKTRFIPISIFQPIS
ncbi:MAG: hypothetical protein CMO46_12800 [Verrucomicrobiales bacterium]|nr:hypothetical protein [Verrucomicrobiales bacterium]